MKRTLETLVSAVVGITVLFSPHLRAGEKKTSRFNSWHIYWDSKAVDVATARYASHLDHIGLFGAAFDEKGQPLSTFPSLEKTLTALRQRAPRQKILLTVVNDVMVYGKPKLKDPSIIHQLLSEPEKTTTLVNQLTTLATPFDGLEIDFESLSTTDRDAFSGFISLLSAKLHQQGKILSVVVEPKTKDTHRNGPGAMDWPALSQSADIIKVMAYYNHFPSGPPGPVAPAAWVEEIVKFALTQIPKEKLIPVLVLNGVDWSNQTKGKPIDFQSAISVAEKMKAKILRDPASQSPYFRYQVGTAHHLVWFEDKASLDLKLDALERLGVSHIGLWRLGTGDPAFWDLVSNN